jgi:hypothetical protein
MTGYLKKITSTMQSIRIFVVKCRKNTAKGVFLSSFQAGQLQFIITKYVRAYRLTAPYTA